MFTRYIILISSFTLTGLLLVPNGKDLGKQLGDIYRDRSFNASSNNETLTDPTADHPWGVVFTILGTVLLDFDADACQSPSRAYLLDVTVPGKPNYALYNVNKFLRYSMATAGRAVFGYRASQ